MGKIQIDNHTGTEYLKRCIVCRRRITSSFWLCRDCEAVYGREFIQWPPWLQQLKADAEAGRRQETRYPKLVSLGAIEWAPSEVYEIPGKSGGGELDAPLGRAELGATERNPADPAQSPPTGDPNEAPYLSRAQSLGTVIRRYIDALRPPVYAEPLLQWAPYDTWVLNWEYRRACKITERVYVTVPAVGPDPNLEDSAGLLSALQQLPEAERDTLLLEAQGYTQTEIAARAGKSERTIRRWRTAALGELRRAFA